MANIGLVPQKRLGELLARRRESYGYTIEDMARRSSGRFTVRELEGFEAGTIDLDDSELEALSLLYEFNSSPPTPGRSRLIIAADEDLPAGTTIMSDEQKRLVLIRYLALLYLLRNANVGEPMSLRGEDLAMLGQAFGQSADVIGAELERLMLEGAEIGEQVEKLRRRLVVPAAGLLVGPTPAGALVLVK